MTLLPTSIPANFSYEAVYENLNDIDDTWCPYDGNDWIFTVVPVCLLIISVLGIILNVFVLMVFWLTKKACTVAEIYLSNLAAADLLLMSTLPFWAVVVAKRYNWNLSETLCKLVPFSISMNAYCSIHILVLVGIDRYLALVHPLTQGRMRRPLCAKLACIVVWGVCFLFNIPILIYREVEHDTEGNTSSCHLNYSERIENVVNSMNIMVNFIIPVFIISFCTVKIIQALRNRPRDNLNTQGKEQKATTLILVVLLAFLICWAPFNVVKILYLLSLSEIVGMCKARLNFIQQIFTYLAIFNSVLNPILYVCVGGNFRRKVKEVFSQMCNKAK